MKQDYAVSGWKGSTDYFRFRELDEFSAEAVVDVLRGRVAGVVFRGIVPADVCGDLAARFWASPARRTRGADAPGFYLGTYHYHKTTTAYLDECAAIRGEIDDILDVPGNPIRLLHQGLGKALAQQGAEFRLAAHQGREAIPAVLRSWHGQQEYALDPHEDLGQCTEPRQADFEIQRAAGHTITAMNMCLQNGKGGRLVLWNVVPDEATRRGLGLHYSGTPYPLPVLDGVESLWLDVRPGDVYLFNGALIHAVEPNRTAADRRLTLSGILGFVDDRTVVSWT